jgi:hypothetical protein
MQNPFFFLHKTLIGSKVVNCYKPRSKVTRTFIKFFECTNAIDKYNQAQQAKLALDNHAEPFLLPPYNNNRKQGG